VVWAPFLVEDSRLLEVVTQRTSPTKAGLGKPCMPLVLRYSVLLYRLRSWAKRYYPVLTKKEAATASWSRTAFLGRSCLDLGLVSLNLHRIATMLV